MKWFCQRASGLSVTRLWPIFRLVWRWLLLETIQAAVDEKCLLHWDMEWNCLSLYKQVLNDQTWTSNFTEAAHGKLEMEQDMDHPFIWSFIENCSDKQVLIYNNTLEAKAYQTKDKLKNQKYCFHIWLEVFMDVKKRLHTTF